MVALNVGKWARTRSATRLIVHVYLMYKQKPNNRSLNQQQPSITDPILHKFMKKWENGKCSRVILA